MKAFIAENDDVLKRDYFREKVYTKDLTKAAQSDIIEVDKSQKPITTITEKAIERVPNVEINGYTKEQCKFIQQQHKELLNFGF
ncbi:MAG: hypothetical protein LUI06_09965 [Ruminococcus sp.]|nr:hypothetical protein [Ruminococcus sp.]